MLELAGIALAWGLYGLIHSWLAGDAIKRRLAERWPRCAPAYRLVYNLLALLLLIPPLWLTWRASGETLWTWPGWISWPALLLSVGGFAWSLRWYDGLDFLGLRQWQRGTADPDEAARLVISPLHRYVRHPWYSLGLLLLWTRDLNAAWLLTATVLTAYLLLGSRLEERKLLRLFGEPYRRYLRQVPGLVPWPGRHLDAAAAEALRAAAADRADQRH